MDENISNAVIDEIHVDICKLISLYFFFSVCLSHAQRKAYNIEQQSVKNPKHLNGTGKSTPTHLLD